MIHDLTHLKTEYETDPESRGYVSMTDAELESDLNLKRIPYTRKVPNRDIKTFALAFGLLRTIAQEATRAESGTSLNSAETQDASIYFRSLFNDPEGIQDFDFVRAGDPKPLIEMLLDAMESDGLMTAIQKANCIGLKSVISVTNMSPLLMSKVESLYGIGVVARMGDIQEVR
jgi:hypothetical protein